MNLFVGVFPPPYGGVTIKSNILLREIFSNIQDLEVVDLFECERNITKILNLVKLLHKVNRQQGCVIVATDSKRMILLLRMIRLIGGSSFLKKVSIFMMGGDLQDKTKKNKSIRKLISKVGVIYTESNKINLTFAKQGIKNTDYFPNAKSIANSVEPKYRNTNSKGLKCVYFSLISKEKGVVELIKMYNLLTPEQKNIISIDFFGHVVSEIKSEFGNFVSENDNIKYMGVFDAIRKSVYTKLHEYDVVLFPTLWEKEGIPGILVEAKMSGIVPIVSDRSFNAEIVKDREEGIVVTGDFSRGFCQALNELWHDHDHYNRLAKGSFESRKRYAIETYSDAILKKTLGL